MIFIELGIIARDIPFKEESKRGKENSGSGLSIEDEDKIVHSMIKGSFREKKHACIYCLNYENDQIGLLIITTSSFHCCFL